MALALHSRMAVIGPNAVLSFSQAARGWFPDSGATYMLPRLDTPGLGMFLALTGHKLMGYDIVAARFVDHFLPPTMVDALFEAGKNALNYASFQTVFNDAVTIFGQQMAEDHTFCLTADLEKIDACFDKDSVEEILEALDAHGDWGKTHAAKIRAACPTSVKLTHRLLRDARTADFKSCLRTEYRCALNMMARADFRAGLERTPAGSGQTPNFYPLELSEVDDATISDLLSLPKGAVDLNFDQFEPIVAPHDVVDVQPSGLTFSNRTSRRTGHVLPTERNVRKKIVEVTRQNFN
jgi:enoyl-CoA hydratase/carnithine racemase